MSWFHPAIRSSKIVSLLAWLFACYLGNKSTVQYLLQFFFLKGKKWMGRKQPSWNSRSVHICPVPFLRMIDRVLINVMTDNGRHLNNAPLFIRSSAFLASRLYGIQMRNKAKKRSFLKGELSGNRRRKGSNCAVWQPEKCDERNGTSGRKSWQLSAVSV